MSIILDGKKVRDSIKFNISNKIKLIKPDLTLAIIQVGNKEESNAYIAQKKTFGESVGVKILLINYPEYISEAVIIGQIKKLNDTDTVHGIIVQLPLPKRLHSETILDAIDPKKDVDGLTGTNLKLLMANKSSGIMPATVRGIMTLLDYYKISLVGKKVVIVGRSLLVGKSLALVLLNRNATVTVCHTQTKNLSNETKQAEILITAIGNPEFFDRNFISSEQVVVDVGISRMSSNGEPDKHLVGDVLFDDVKNIVSAITPVPGGVGPMTVVSLFQNLLDAYEMQKIDKNNTKNSDRFFKRFFLSM